MKSRIEKHFAGHIRTMEIVVNELAPAIEECVRLLVAALRGGNKILIMGNGGSAADAQHFAAE
jgi:D-sedoheptulose 7-phosphate isomerase